MDTKDKEKTTGMTNGTEKSTTAEKGAAAAKETATAKSAMSAAESKSSKGSSDKKTSKNMEEALETAKGGSLYKFFTDMLKDMYYAEKQILDTLPKMQKEATTEELKEAFEDHHLQTQKQVSRLEKVFKLMDEKVEGKKCEAILGIIKEGESAIEETEKGTMTRDAALIISAQKVEHYEMASYGGLCALAETLGLYEASDILHISLEEETKTDGDLTHIAESYINFFASEDDNFDDEYDEDMEYDDSYEDEREGQYDDYSRGKYRYESQY